MNLATRPLLGPLAALLLLPLCVAAQAGTRAGSDGWQMKQRDMHNTGRADYEVPAERLNDTFFDVFAWQKPAPGSPGEGNLDATSMVFMPGAGPGGADLVLGTYHWPKGVQGMDMHDGSLFWYGNPAGGETIARITPAFANDGATIYVVNDATENEEFPDGFPLMAFNGDVGPSAFWHNGVNPQPWHLEKISPTVGPDDLVYLHQWDERPYAGWDDGLDIWEAWMAATPAPACYSDPVLHEGSYGLVIVEGARDGTIRCWDGIMGNEVWYVEGCGPIDASVTIDPDTGHIYVSSGFDHVWVTGLDEEGYPLWSQETLLVHEYLPGTNSPQRAQATGCLSHDGGTYYFQTNSDAGDGRLYAIDTGDGSVRWSHATGSRGWEIESSCPIVTPNGVIVVGNNWGDTYLALLDEGTHATLLDTFAVNTDGITDSRAVASATLSAEGLLYLPLRTWWTQGNGDGDTPSAEVANLFAAFDVTEDAVASLPAPAGQMAFALDAAVQLFWDEIADPGGIFDHYAVYRDTAPFASVAGMTPLATVFDIGATEHLDDTAANGTSYFYAVTTVCSGGTEQTAVEAIGPRTPRHEVDLQVVSISRTPRYPRYCAEYTVYEIAEPGGFGPYYCSAATGLGCGQDETTQHLPAAGETMTYTATVRNRGTVAVDAGATLTWTVDGAPHQTDVETLALAPGETAAFATQLAWDGLSHEIAFACDLADDRPGNNALAIDTRSVAFFSCVERSRLEEFREETVGYPQAVTDDFIDWLNLHMARLNAMFAAAGCGKRVHYDRLPVVGDDDPDPAVEPIQFAIFPFRYEAGEASLRTSGYYHADEDVDYGLLHEWGHQLGLIDLYRLNLEPWQNAVTGEAYRACAGLMQGCDPFISEHSAHAMNLWLDVAHGYFGQYLYSLPEHVKLRFTDTEGRPLRSAQVRVYQKAERPGMGEVLSDQVKFAGLTDAWGEWTLPNVDIDPLLVPPLATGDTLQANPFGYVHVVGCNGLFLIEVELDGIVHHVWLDIAQVNNAYWAGETGTAVFEWQLEFADYMFVLPDELTEFTADQWSGHADGGYTVTLTDDTGMVMAGGASIRYDTDGPFDTWMRYPGSGHARWNMESLGGFEFWVHAQNENFSFQEHSPWIFLNCADGSYEYHATSELLNGAVGNWVHCDVPLAGSADWDLIEHGSPDLGRVRSIEFHADTWDDSFTLWIDGLHFALDPVAVDDAPAPARLRLAQNRPNPFNPSTLIGYDLPAAGMVSLRVFDTRGRQVRALVAERQAAGGHEAVWDGRDDAGRPQSSGVYFYRLEAAGATLTRRMLLLK
ncbi:MAG: PQQ-binding-like beta-propeller repeat protein [Candidatus Krumholzibacteriota bacterium]|nr:PQQ-binding-like beta-propeller repeat protein [Candidatus Krumholzibacteriota bacterium]